MKRQMLVNMNETGKKRPNVKSLKNDKKGLAI